jgi:hypothetical protein
MGSLRGIPSTGVMPVGLGRAIMMLAKSYALLAVKSR